MTGVAVQNLLHTLVLDLSLQFWDLSNPKLNLSFEMCLRKRGILLYFENTFTFILPTFGEQFWVVTSHVLKIRLRKKLHFIHVILKLPF